MTTIQVLPHEVRQGDRITINAKVEFTGQPFDLNGRRVIALYYDTDASSTQSHYVDPDQPLTVDRPDPDAGLIEAMADAMSASDEGGDSYRTLATRALAALREFEAGA